MLHLTGQVFLQSDVEEVTAAMRNEFEEYGSRYFRLADVHFLRLQSSPEETSLGRPLKPLSSVNVCESQGEVPNLKGLQGQAHMVDQDSNERQSGTWESLQASCKSTLPVRKCHFSRLLAQSP